MAKCGASDHAIVNLHLSEGIHGTLLLGDDSFYDALILAFDQRNYDGSCKMRLVDFNGRATISHKSILDQIDSIAGRFLFTRDVAKSGHFISNETNAT